MDMENLEKYGDHFFHHYFDHFPNFTVSSVDSVNQVLIKRSSSVNY